MFVCAGDAVSVLSQWAVHVHHVRAQAAQEDRTFTAWTKRRTLAPSPPSHTLGATVDLVSDYQLSTKLISPHNWFSAVFTYYGEKLLSWIR